MIQFSLLLINSWVISCEMLTHEGTTVTPEDHMDILSVIRTQFKREKQQNSYLF